ncbi:Mitochodrial transcription termination factor-related protein [Corchorus capsularis]|uniref:Mitochodrial transcription termination factor-related protein n=1 Tax=Corchorus capsularis TaxID=210143 RepID=A0A1R3HK63_COCAP|nr:Mitochodrial transcription termination factor-related protein [Corchorus capsularis]
MHRFSKNLYSHLSRHFSTLPKLPHLTKIPSKYRTRAIKDAQQALTDYLHGTRYVPFVYAENICKYSLYSLSGLISDIDFSSTGFTRNILEFLKHHPINEFEFFFESIGIDYKEVSGLLPANKFSFSKDERLLDAACALCGYGFPWNSIGKLYKEEVSILRISSGELKAKLSRIKERGFSNTSVIGICLAFPYVLRGDGEICALVDDLKTVFVDFDLGSCVEANVDAWYEICRKMRLFYDLGYEKGKIGELMGRSKDLFLQYPQEVLVQKVEYFQRFAVRDKDIEERNSIAQEYPYVMGRNKMANLPYVMRALSLHKWFFNKIKDGNHQLLAKSAISDPNEDVNEDFRDGLEKIQSSRTPVHTMNKLNFFQRIGFGENSLTLKVLTDSHGTSIELQERFNILLGAGIEFSKACKMVKVSPRVLNHKPEILEQKLNFLCHEMGVSLDYLDIFPAFLRFNLENRIKPRCRFHKWLTEKGWCTRNYSIASIVATSEKAFVARIHGIHPDAVKEWYEKYSCSKPGNNG